MQGESSHHYTYQAGLALLGSPNLQLGAIRGTYELVNKRDWKGQLQTTLLRIYKGQVDIRYTSTQAVRTDDFHATVILTHSDPLIGSCQVVGSYQSTKKASEKTAAEKACNMIDLDTLVFTPKTAEKVSKDLTDMRDYAAGNDSVQKLGTALKGLFGNNYEASAPAALPMVSPLSGLPLSVADEMSTPILPNYSNMSIFSTLGMDSGSTFEIGARFISSNTSSVMPTPTAIAAPTDSLFCSPALENRLRGGSSSSVDSYEKSQYSSISKLESGIPYLMDDSISFISQTSGRSSGEKSFNFVESVTNSSSRGHLKASTMSEIASSITDESSTEMSQYNREEDWGDKDFSYLIKKESLLSNPAPDFGGCIPRPPLIEDKSPGVTQKPSLGRSVGEHSSTYDPVRKIFIPKGAPQQSYGQTRATSQTNSRGHLGSNRFPRSSGSSSGSAFGRGSSRDVDYMGPNMHMRGPGPGPGHLGDVDYMGPNRHIRGPGPGPGHLGDVDYMGPNMHMRGPGPGPGPGHLGDVDYMGPNMHIRGPGPGPGHLGDVDYMEPNMHIRGPGPGAGSLPEMIGSSVGPSGKSIAFRNQTRSTGPMSRTALHQEYSQPLFNAVEIHNNHHSIPKHTSIEQMDSKLSFRREGTRHNMLTSGVPIIEDEEAGLTRLLDEVKNLNSMVKSPYQTGEIHSSDSYVTPYPQRYGPGPGRGYGGGQDQDRRVPPGRYRESSMNSRSNSNTPYSTRYPNSTRSSRHTAYYRDLDSSSDSKSRVSNDDDPEGLSENKATDWKGELQTFLARNCKDFPFKIEYNSDERIASGKYKARVTITFDNKDEETRVVHGVPAVNKKATERAAAGLHTHWIV